MYLRKHCKQCDDEISASKRKNIFCSSSCAASYNNIGRRRHGNPPGICKYCGQPKKSAQTLYCSTICCGLDKRKITDLITYTRLKNREANARYRARLQSQTPNDVDRQAITEFYAACPPGYEVDHIIPISKGGLHTLSNLQYLTRAENRSKHNKIL